LKRGTEEINMPLYMVQFAYTSDAWAALVDTQEDRSVAIASVAATMGSRMVSYYLTFGEYDGFTLIEAPDEVTAAAIVMVAVKSGHLKATKTTTVLSVEDGMAAMRKARQASFLAPGQSEESGPS
jgi:uncharacterized protein with GYD domain